MEIMFLVGPTAVGKTAVGVGLAKQLGAEIVSADSMLVYRGMDIGTAKPTLDERGGVPHHLIDVVEVRDSFDAAKYRQLALTAIANIERRGKQAMVVGGTGLYVRALTRGLDPLPQADAELRAQLEAQPLERLAAQLSARDPLAAGKIDLKNKRRVIRALEVLELSGQSIVALQRTWGEPTLADTSQSSDSRSAQPSTAARLVGLTRHREDLHRRIDARVDEMFRLGIVEEVRGLLAQGLEKNTTAFQAVGYKEVAAYLRGETTLEQCKQSVKIATRQLAKRQLTWFRRETNLAWVELNETETVEETTRRVLDIINKSQREG